MLRKAERLEDPSEQPAPTFRELGFPFPEPTLFDLDIQAPIGNRLVRAAKARHIPQFRA